MDESTLPVTGVTAEEWADFIVLWTKIEPIVNVLCGLAAEVASEEIPYRDFWEISERGISGVAQIESPYDYGSSVESVGFVTAKQLETPAQVATELRAELVALRRAAAAAHEAQQLIGVTENLKRVLSRRVQAGKLSQENYEMLVETLRSAE